MEGPDYNLVVGAAFVVCRKATGTRYVLEQKFFTFINRTNSDKFRQVQTSSDKFGQVRTIWFGWSEKKLSVALFK